MMKKAFTNLILIRRSWILILLAVIQLNTAGQTSHAVAVTKNVFTPDEIIIKAGDTVVWTNNDGAHNVNGLKTKFPSNPESFGNSVATNWTFSHVFAIPGSYDYQCDPHVDFGMTGKVFVEKLPDTLTVNFTGMDPHVGQMFVFYVRDKVSGAFLDTIEINPIPGPEFTIKSGILEPGNKYVVDMYADLNNNSLYDAPPVDHAWRLETAESVGNIVIDFVHSGPFTDIMSPIPPHIRLAMDENLGSILTDAEGFTLYYFTRDALTDTSLCTGGCVTNWPLFYVENPEFGEGLDSADFSSIVHPEGGMQTTYKGWPLYYFKNDLNPGETKGEAVGEVWFVAKPDYSIMLLNGLLLGKDGVTYNSNYEPGEEVVQYFVDEYGMTLYAFIIDTYDRNNFTNPDFSNNPIWPVYEEELQSVASTLDKNLFNSIDVFGHKQLTYKGWPLYYYITDSVRGNTSGVSVPRPGVWPVAVKDMETAPVPVVLAEDSVLGTILTDGDGFTLYYFTRDALPNTSLCTGGCVANWPLFYGENLKLGDGLDSADFSSIIHPEGGMQTTYKSWPLYYFSNDLNPGETKGEAVGNVWFVAKPDYSIMLLNGLLTGKNGVTYNSVYEPGEEMVQFFVDDYGMTLYTWINDSYDQNNFTNADFSNNPSWPVFEKELQRVPSTLDTTLLGSIDVFERQQLTYKGWPLYYFGSDSLKGNTLGVSVPSPGVWPVAVQSVEPPIASTVQRNNLKSEIQIYPNPTTEMLNIVSDEPIESVTIFSVTGSRILSIQNIQSTHHVMSLGGIDPGVYFVEIFSTDKRKEVSRLIKR